MNALFDKTIDRLSGFITYRTRKHEVQLSNIINIDTPGFKASEVNFQDAMKSASANLVRTDSRHLQGAKGGEKFTIVRTEESVNLDKSMADLAENQLMHNSAVEMLARKLRTLQTILK
ncbi:MAG: Flagellar basal body rod protein FlgB [Syntrophus sp. SKADARSKE-3]|nr:Flagellar basal body rod protein FlgB [Syntrophus sp. SKADARSKE-3]